MKKHFQKICNSLAIVSLAVFGQTDVTAQETFTINSDFSNNFVQSQNIDFLPVYKIHQKEVDFYKLEKIQVLTNDYERVSKEIESVKSGYEQYISRQEAIKTIITELNEFINSSDSYDTKEKYLIASQNLATKHNIIIEVKDERLTTSFLKEVTNDNSTKTRKLFIYKNGKRSSNKDVMACKEFIEKIPYNEPVEAYRDYNTYLRLTQELLNIPKTEIREVKSNVSERKSIMILDSTITDVNAFVGRFVELPTKYIMIVDNCKDQFVKYQLVDGLKDCFNKGYDTRYSIVRNVDTNAMYYLMNDEYLSKLRGNQKTQWLIEAVNKLGYKEYKSADRYDENLYIKSKTCEIKLDAFTYSVLKANPNFIVELDADQAKIESLTKQTSAHTQTLEKYINIYNIKRSKMSATDLSAWRTATSKAQTLQAQIYKLTEKYDGNYSFKPINKNNLLNDFLDSLLASKGALGM